MAKSRICFASANGFSAKAEHAAQMIRKACLKEGVRKDEVHLHSDNGSPMKGATMAATLRDLGITP